MDFKISKLSKHDVSQMVALTLDILKTDFPYKEETINAYCKIFNQKYFEDLLEDEKNVIFGASDNDKLVGFIVAKGDFGGVIYVDLLGVYKNYRGKGLGLRLIEAVEKWALSHKYHYFWLYTETEKNIEFYKKRNFRYIGKHINSWFGEDEHLLGKELRETPFSEVFSKE